MKVENKLCLELQSKRKLQAHSIDRLQMTQVDSVEMTHTICYIQRFVESRKPMIEQNLKMLNKILQKMFKLYFVYYFSL